MKQLLFKVVPWCFFALFATEIVAILLPRPDKEFHLTLKSCSFYHKEL